MLPPKTLKGASVRKYLSALIAADRDLSPEMVRRVVARLAGEITQVRVRRPIPRRSSPPQAAPPPIRPTATDPFAFSLVAVLTKEGRLALETRLALVATREELLAMAHAQHIALPDAAATLAELRSQIITGTERRLADRRAAAG